MEVIKPNVKPVIWIIIIAFMIFATGLFLSPYFFSDLAMQLIAIFLATCSLVLLWGLDYSHLTIQYNNDDLKLTGYFNGRKVRIKMTDIKGYQIEGKADQYSGYHEEMHILTRQGKTIRFPIIAYADYSEIMEFCSNNFEFLGYKSLKFAKVMGRVLPVMGLISGILALLVGILKYLK